MRRRPWGAVWILSLLGAAGAVAAEPAEWLPAAVEQGAVEQLVGRLEATGLGPGDAARRREGARAVVDGLRATLESWGEDEVLRRAPEFPGLAVPAAGDRHLDAMARYHVCNMVLVLQLRNPDFDEDTDALATGVFGLSAITLAVVYLRQPYLAAGGDEGGIEAHLAGPGMEPVLTRLRTDEAALRQAETQCQPITVALLEAPIERLDALADPAE